MSTKRRAFSDEFKAKVALEALKEHETIAQIASRYDVLPVQVSQWKAQLLERLPGLFSKGRKREKENEDWQEREARLFQKIGQLEVEREWVKKKLLSSGCSLEAKRAMMDWHSRQVLAWEISNTLDTAFCLRALRYAIALFGAPGIMNTDHGCQYTSEAWINELKTHGVQISMDGRGRAMDNVFVERLWRTVNYEEVYRREYGSLIELRHCLAAYFRFYNHVRPHSVHDGKTPAEVHGVTPMQEAS